MLLQFEDLQQQCCVRCCEPCDFVVLFFHLEPEFVQLVLLLCCILCGLFYVLLQLCQLRILRIHFLLFLLQGFLVFFLQLEGVLRFLDLALCERQIIFLFLFLGGL